MNKNQRKKKNAWVKLTTLIMLLLVLSVIHLSNYSFENIRYNGFILLIASFIVAILIDNNKFYIDFGIKAHDVERLNKMDEFRLFNHMHPYIAILNKLNAITFFVLLAVSIFMIIKSFF